jgi:hypothetical protein
MAMVQAGADPVYGARPLNRLLNRELLNPLARALIDGTVQDHDEVHLSAPALHTVTASLMGPAWWGHSIGPRRAGRRPPALAAVARARPHARQAARHYRRRHR